MYRKEKLLVFVFLLIICNFIRCDGKHNDIFRKQLFDLNWKFSIGNQSFASEVDFNDQNWRSLDLPHDWSKDTKLIKASFENQSDSLATEIAWYRKHFEIPQNWLSKNIILNFEGICDGNEIFINGNPIVLSQKRNNKFQTILNPYLNAQGDNVVAIRLTMSKKTGDIWPSESGIYKHVWLVIEDSSEFKN